MDYNEYKQLEKKRIDTAINLLNQGVEFVDINTAYIDESVKIGAGTVIGPCVTLEGETVIGKNCKILQNSRISNGIIADEVEIESSVILDSEVGSKTKVGPFAYIRPGSKVGNECKIGDFVEVKNSTIDDGSKSAHLTYIGDADVGKNVNFGCGVVLVNYDGSKKYRSTIGNGAFIGCNTNLVSPVKVEDGAYIAAGSTVTEDVPADSLCIARARQRNIVDWATKKALYIKK